jgi:hypothetical protein
MPKLAIATEQNRPIHDGRVFQYLAVTDLVFKSPVSTTGGRYDGSILTSTIRAYTEIGDEFGLVQIEHPTWQRSITIPNFQADMPVPFVQLPITSADGLFLRLAAGIIQSQLTDLGAIEVVE